MKKLFLSVAVLALTSTAAFADDHGEKKHKGPRMDKDGDGVVSKSEFMAVQEERFEKMDANGDGSIEKEEFKAARKDWKEKRKEMQEKRKERRENRGKGQSEE